MYLGGIFRIANGQELDSADRTGNREYVLDLCLIECPCPMLDQSSVIIVFQYERDQRLQRLPRVSEQINRFRRSQ